MRSSHVAKSVSAVFASLVLATMPVSQGAVLAAEPAAQADPSGPDIRNKHQQAARGAGVQNANADAVRNGRASQPDRQPGAGTGTSAAANAGRSAPAAQAGSQAERGAEAHGSRTQTIPNQLIVVYKDDSAFQAGTVAPGVGHVVKEHQARHSRLLQVNDAAAARQALAADANVSSVEENQVALPMYSMPNDPNVSNEWHLFPFVQTHGVDVANRTGAAAWDLTRGASSSSRIAFLDTGLDWTHSDISPKSPLGYNFAE